MNPRRDAHSSRTPLLFAVGILLITSVPALAAITPAPATVTLTPGQTSAPVSLNLTFPASPLGAVISFSVNLAGLPPGASTLPPVIAVTSAAGATSATTSFQIATTSFTPAGTYAVTMTTSPDVGAGIGMFTLVVQNPTFDTTVTPASLSLAWGEAASISVSTVASGGFAGSINYSFSGFPAGIVTGPPQVVGPPYAPVSFPISVAQRTLPGVYSGLLVGSSTPAGGATLTKSVPVTVSVEPPTLSAGFTPSSINLTVGGAATQTMLMLTPGNGYAGTPNLSFPALPANLEITPVVPMSPPLPPAQSIPLNIRATSAATGPQTITVRVVDATARIDTTASLLVSVNQPNIAAAFTPATLTLVSRGAAAQTTLSLTPVNGYTGTPTLSFVGLPTNLEITPATLTANPMPPGRSIPLTVRATGPLPATQTVTVRITDPLARVDTTASFVVSVVKPGIIAAFNPANITLVERGAPMTTTLMLTPTNGYAGTPALTIVGAPNLEITPATLASPPLPPAQSIPITLRATGPGSRTITLRVADAAAGVESTATIAVTVTQPPDATIAVTPPTVSLTAGTSTNVVVSAASANGFTGVLNVTAPPAGQLTFNPAAFSLRAGESRSVSVTAAVAAPAGAVRATFTAVSPDLGGSRMATVVVNVVRPQPEISAVAPQAWAAANIGTRVRLTGAHFAPGAIITFTPPGPLVTSTIITSANAAEIVVTTPPQTKPGPYRIDLRNPDGGTTSPGATVVIYSAGSLAGPVGVSTAATVFPRPFATVAYDDPLYPRALIATSGVGTIIGTWRLDGVPFDQFVVAASGGLPVEVKAKMPIPVTTAGEHRLELVIEQPHRIVAAAVPVVLSMESRTALRIITPEDGAVIGPDAAVLRWTLVPGASGYAIELAKEGDETIRTLRVSESEWRLDAAALRELGPGSYRFRVAAVFTGEVEGKPTAWRRFAIETAKTSAAIKTGPPAARYLLASLGGDDPATAQETSPVAAAPLPPQRLSAWTVGLSGFGSETEEDNHVGGDAARLQLTTQANIETAKFALKETADVSERKDLDPIYDTAAENRAWQFELGAIQAGFREELRAGYSPPDFLDQSEFLAAGLSRGGALARQMTPIGSFSYYDTFHHDAAGAVSAYDLSQQVSGAAWQAPFDPNRSLLRVMGLRARSNVEDSFQDSESEAFGMFWRHTFSPAFTLAFEGASGKLDDPTGDLDGNAFRLGASGMRGTLSWGVNLRSTDGGFVNPLNAGLTAGAAPDRNSADLTVGKLFGQKNLMLQFRRQESDAFAGIAGGDVSETSGSLTFITPITPAVSFTATSSISTTLGDGDAPNFIPATDRSMTVLGVTFSESVKGFALAQSLTWQDVTDEVFTSAEQSVSGASFSFGGAVGSAVNVIALLSGTRSEGPAMGTTDSYVGSLQPTLTWSTAGVSMTPSVTYSRNESEHDPTSESEGYQLLMQWAPTRWNSLVAFQLASDWNRSTVEGFPAAGFHRRIVGNVTLHWSASRTTSAPAIPAAVPATASLAQLLQLVR